MTQATDIPVTCKIILNLQCQNFKQIFINVYYFCRSTQKMALLKITVWYAFTQKYTPPNYYKLLWNGTFYFDNAEVTMPQTVDTLKNSAITQQHLGGGGEVGQGKSHCTPQIAQGYLQHLWVTLNLHRYNLGFPIVYYVHHVKNDLLYVWSGMNSLVEWAVRGVDNECTFLWAMKQLVSV